jgi:signal transduction histidine kinase
MKTKSVKSNNSYKSVIQTCIVKAHGGELMVESTENEGSHIIIFLDRSQSV